MKTKNEYNIYDLADTGDLIRLTCDGETSIVTLKTGGRRGGAEFDLYFAHYCYEENADESCIEYDFDTSIDECSEIGISV